MQNINQKFKKILTILSSRLFYFILGLSFVFTIYATHAAWYTTVTSGTALTPTLWNDLVAQISNEWKIIAQGSDWTEEAIITLSSSEPSFEIDTQFSNQRVNIGTFNWPTDGKVNEIIFKVYNAGDGYCVGGMFTQNLTNNGVGTYPKCQDFRYQGGTLSRGDIGDDDAIKININGTDMEYCPDQYGRKSTNSAYPGTFGHPWFDIMCYYKKNVDFFGDITQIKVKEIDWSGDYGSWRWEIWYR